jgi:hypothetical protein
MDKVAVGLFGIHYKESFIHWAGWTANVDFRKTYDNNKSVLFDQLDTTFFSATYFSPILNELIDAFSFKKLKLSNLDNTDVHHTFKKRNKIFLDTIRLILEDDANYDYVLLTRYDLIFRENPFKLTNNSKVNLICKAAWGENHDLVDDNFYFMPYNLLSNFYDTLKDIDLSTCPHEFHKYYKDFHFMLEDDRSYYTHEIPTYAIYRDIISHQ